MSLAESPEQHQKLPVDDNIEEQLAEIMDGLRPMLEKINSETYHGKSISELNLVEIQTLLDLKGVPGRVSSLFVQALLEPQD